MTPTIARRAPGRVGLTVAIVSVGALFGVTVWVVAGIRLLTASRRLEFGLALAVLWVVFAIAVLALRRVRARTAVVVILAGAVALGGAAMTGPPNTSTDSARYAWDGIVQNAGISPYAYAPDDDALASLRPDWLFPAPVAAADGHLTCPEPRTHLITTEPSGTELCTAINRAGVTTIYPPTSELYFAAIRAVVPADAEYWPLQAGGLLIYLGITVLLIVGLRRRAIDPWWAALWAFNPLVVSEAVTNSHVDALGAILALAAAFAVSAGLRWRGGVLLGAAIAAKLIPVLSAPALLRRQPAKIVVAAVATFAVLYVPYVVTTGIGVLGYLPGYLTEEGYDDGSRFVLLTAFLPGSVALVVAAVLLAAIAVLVIVFSDPRRPWTGQVVMIGSALLIASPRYAWYALLLVPFIVLSRRWEWLAVPLVLSFHTVAPQHLTFRVTLLAAIVVIAGASWARRRLDRLDRRGGRGSAAPEPSSIAALT